VASDYETCKDTNDGGIVKSVIFCAGVCQWEDICEGYSGGPIFNQEGTQVEVVCWDHGCAQNDFPAV
jgi:secreted trypsin-like serine protease